ncbi:MAG TPA: hypothetical protein VFE62_08525 [Gemmataceae bacterium]|nr:hypothetical protein [Gemmataceae bacterium]
MNDAIQSGPPPIPAPFLLDPGYQGTLESDAFRRRFESLIAMPRNIPAYGCYALFFSVIFVVPAIAYIVYTRSPEVALGVCGSGIMVWGLIAYFAWVYSGGWRYERRMRRLARHGTLVQGVVASAKRVRQTIPGSDFSEDDDAYTVVALEIKYRANTPAGETVHGSGMLRRDDLLNAELPRPGTPVWVLVLNRDTHAIL